MSEPKSFWQTFITSPAVFFLVMFLVFASGVVAYGVAQRIWKVTTSGSTVGGVNCTIWNSGTMEYKLTFIEWNEYPQGQEYTKNITVYVHNIGGPGYLTWVVDMVDPTNFFTNYASFYTDYGGVIIQKNQTLPVTLFLTVHDNAPLMDMFGFDIVMIMDDYIRPPSVEGT